MTVADSTVPAAGAETGVHEKAPAALATAVHTGVPTASVTTTVEPGSARPVMGLPSVGFITAAAGAAESATTEAAGDTLPDASVAVTVSGAPFAGTGIGLQLKDPMIMSAVVVHSTVPEASMTLTVAPNSALPVTGLPSVGLTVGAAGATESATTEAAGDTLPARSLAVTFRVAPLAGTGDGVQLNEPFAAATVVHSTVPSASDTVTVEPASAVPVTRLPSVGLTVGVTGAAESTVTGVAGETLPAASLAVTASTVPLAGTVAGVQVQVPLAATVAVQTGVPTAVFTTMVDPTSPPVPVMVEPLVVATTGAAGATVSTVTVAGIDALPAPTLAVADSTAPLTGAGAAVQLHVPLAAATAVHSVRLAASFTVTVEPGVAVPETGAPLVGFITGAVGRSSTASR